MVSNWCFPFQVLILVIIIRIYKDEYILFMLSLQKMRLFQCLQNCWNSIKICSKCLSWHFFFFSVSNYRAVTIGIKSLEQRDNLSKRSLQLWSMPLHNLNLACIMMCDYLSTDWIYHYLNLRIPNCDES